MLKLVVFVTDTLPGIQEKRKPVTLCHVGFDSQCSRNSSIRVTNCGTFFVYELTPLDICQSAYCFGENKKNTFLDITTTTEKHCNISGTIREMDTST